MFIKFNERTVSRVEESMAAGKRPQRKKRKRPTEGLEQQCVEMGEDYEEDDEEQPSIAGLFKRPERKEAEAVEQKAERRSELDLPSVPAVSAVSPAPAPDRVQAFIEQYVKVHGIHAKYTWQDYKLQQLEAAGQQCTPPLRDTVDQLKRRIMAWVRSSEYQQQLAAEEAEASADDVEEEVEN